MTKLIALVATTLILSGFVNSANAAALASASANITSLIWYIDSDGSGDHTDADQVLTSNVLRGGKDTIIRGGSDVIFGDVRLSVGDNENVNYVSRCGTTHRRSASRAYLCRRWLRIAPDSDRRPVC